MSDLAARQLAILKTLTDRLGTVQRGCFCEDVHANFEDRSRKCMSCLVDEARAVIAEYEAAQFDAIDAYEPTPCCSFCGLPDPNVAISTDFDGTRTAQCRACYVAAREREMAGAL